MSTSPSDDDDDEDERAEGKGSGRDDDDDPADGFEDDADSVQVDDAQRTLGDIESQIASGDDTGGSVGGVGGVGGTGGDGGASGGSDGSETTDAGVGGDDSGDDTASDTGEADGSERGEAYIEGKDTLTAEDLSDQANATALWRRLDQQDEFDSVSAGLAEKLNTLGDDDLTPNATDTVNLDNATEITPVGATDRSTGVNDKLTFIATTDSGDEMVITFNSTTTQDPKGGGAAVNIVSNSLSDDAQDDVGFPDVNVDTERDAVVRESVGSDAKRVSETNPDESDASFSKDNYLNAVAGKVVAGDSDISGNIMATSDGEFRPTGFDMAGSDLEERDGEIAEDRTMLDEYDGLWDKLTDQAQENTQQFDFEIEEGDIREKSQELAEEVDTTSLNTQVLRQESISQTDENITTNVELLRDGVV